MRVELKRTWFGPDNTRRRQGVHDVPDKWRDILPRGAVIVATGEVIPPSPDPTGASPPIDSSGFKKTPSKGDQLPSAKEGLKL